MVISHKAPPAGPSSPTPDEAEAFVRRRLSLRHLRVLLALDDGGSLSAAAEALHVTQPAVSKALGEIEAGLGQTLFARRGRGLRATPSGQRLLTLARKLEADLHRGAGDIASIVRGASGELLIGATNAAIARILPDAMAAMKREHPNVTISVRSHALSSLFNELRQGRLDLVIARATPGDKPGDLEGQLLLEQREVVVLSAQHPLARSGRVSWETLTSLAWIWELPGTRTRTLQDRMWQQMGLPLPTDVIETGDVTLELSLMRRLPLATILPQHVAQAAAQAGAVVILPLEVDLGLSELTVWHLREPQSELVERFKQLLHEAAGGVQA